MDPQRDTPLKRFSSLWIGLFILLSFGLGALVVAPWLNNSNVEDEALQSEYDVRLATKAEIDQGQSDFLDAAAAKTAFSHTAKQLLGQNASATSQVVPGSATDLKANSAK